MIDDQIKYSKTFRNISAYHQVIGGFLLLIFIIGLVVNNTMPLNLIVVAIGFGSFSITSGYLFLKKIKWGESMSLANYFIQTIGFDLNDSFGFHYDLFLSLKCGYDFLHDLTIVNLYFSSGLHINLYTSGSNTILINLTALVFLLCLIFGDDKIINRNTVLNPIA